MGVFNNEDILIKRNEIIYKIDKYNQGYTEYENDLIDVYAELNNHVVESRRFSIITNLMTKLYKLKIRLLFKEYYESEIFQELMRYLEIDFNLYQQYIDKIDEYLEYVCNNRDYSKVVLVYDLANYFGIFIEHISDYFEESNKCLSCFYSSITYNNNNSVLYTREKNIQNVENLLNRLMEEIKYVRT